MSLRVIFTIILLLSKPFRSLCGAVKLGLSPDEFLYTEWQVRCKIRMATGTLQRDFRH